MRPLDVACGSGRFPAALLEGGLAGRTGDLRVDVDLLDPSPFSIAEARPVLAPPFAAAGELPMVLQELPADRGPYDVALAVHAPCAVPPDELPRGVWRMVAVIRPGGLGVVAQASPRSHCLVLSDGLPRVPRPGADGGRAGRRRHPRHRRAIRATGPCLPHAECRPRGRRGFLQRCLFDDSLDLEAMCAPGPHGDELAACLAGCRRGDRWAFEHEADLLTWEATR